MRTLDEIQDRIGFLTLRLDRTLNDPSIPARTKLTVKNFEQQTIDALVRQHHERTQRLARYMSAPLT